MLTLDNTYLSAPTHTVDPSDPQILDLASELVQTARALDLTVLTANQTGKDVCLAAILREESWDCAFNLSVTAREGEPQEMDFTTPSFPKQRILLPIHPRIEVEFFSLHAQDIRYRTDINEAFYSTDGGLSWVPSESRGSELLMIFQFADNLLRGVPPKVVPLDFQTIRHSPRTRPNSACPCGSGRKFKKCCERIGHVAKLGG